MKSSPESDVELKWWTMDVASWVRRSSAFSGDGGGRQLKCSESEDDERQCHHDTVNSAVCPQFDMRSLCHAFVRGMEYDGDG
jgi:hypothetical protein